MQDAAIGIVLDAQKILWIKRRDIPIWVLPGGGIDEGESPEQAVLREIEEESGLQATILRKAALYTPVNRWTAATHLFICQSENGVPKTSLEAADVGFFPIANPPEPHFPLHASWLKEALEHTELIERPLNEFTWWKVGRYFLKHPLLLLSYLLTKAARKISPKD